jgi:diguanylate cyclase (GGDEF)-like protein
MSGEAAEIVGAHGHCARSRPDDVFGQVDRRFRLVFALAATALVVINVAVAATVLYQQQQMRDSALALYDRAFVPNNDMNNARVLFQRFADQRDSASGMRAISRANQLLDPVADALDVAADRADEPSLRNERLEARSAVLAFEAEFDDSGPAVWARLKETQAKLDEISAHAMSRGLRARGAIEKTASNCGLLLLASMVAGAGLGLVTLMILRRTIAISTMKRLSRMANYDAVTGLPNRNLLQQRLSDSMLGVRRGDGRLALLSIDLDRFKQVNDTLGHKVGDLLLMEAGERIRRVMRADDTCARFGGDEFVLLLRDVGEADEAGLIAGRLVSALSAPYEFNGQRVLAGASVGIALAPQHGETAEDLLRNSDLALYQAKAAGKGAYRFFENELNASMQARRLMEIDLREAVDQDRVEVFFQPVIDVTSGEIVGCEALARWRRGNGFVSPAVFIPLAEETGLILPLGASVLRKACEAAAGWPANLRVSVNLSARQFQGVDLVALVTDTLRAAGLPANRLELEITESILVGDKPRVLGVLTALRALGVHIALDDFGTGYSSLSYLSSFPFDRIKIDRSFVTDVDSRPEAAAIVRAVTGLAETLGMSTTAEGVETQRDLQWLRNQGCDLAQGYLVSKPVPLEEFQKLLKSWPAERPAAA